jgi:diaminopimelate epimerase
MRFRKYHGTGNDFVMLTDLEARMGAAGSLPSELVAALCDRHTGVGADGLIRIVGPQGDAETSDAAAVARMDYYNADGGAAEMCGNGIRCLAVHEHRAGRLDEGEHVVLTAAGPVQVELAGPRRVTVNMGSPALVLETVPMNGGR